MIPINASSLLSWLVVSLFCLPFFIVAKVLSLRFRPRLKDFLFIIPACLFVSGVILLNRALFDVFIHVIGDYALIILLTLYLCKVSGYSLKKAIPLTSFSFVTVMMAELTLLAILHFLPFPTPAIFSTSFSAAFPTRLSLAQALNFVLPLYIIIALLTAALIRFSKRMRQVINRNPFLQSTVMFFCIYCILFITATANWWRVTTHFSDCLLPSLPIAFIFLHLLLMLFSFHAFVIFSEREKQQKDIEHRNLQYYIDGLEQQQTNILKFKHDHQNFLLSMQAFLDDEDWTGLREFYASMVEAVPSAISESNALFDHLQKIKPREIKSILAAKLIFAQNMNAHIHTTLEANENIYEFPLDSTVLVRILGILLDNAIEALSELTSGTLFVSCLKWESGITFIIENTCQPNMPPLNQIWTKGFSTKGTGRGLGLHTLSELVNTHPNVSIDTSIEGNSFRQALLIEFEEGR